MVTLFSSGKDVKQMKKEFYNEQSGLYYKLGEDGLYTHHNVNRSQLDRLRMNQNVEVNTIDKLCNILDCDVEDIMTHVRDGNRF